MVKLTQKFATTECKLPDGKNERFFWDDELTGFGLRLRKEKAGKLHRTWVAQYRINGRQRRATWPYEKLAAEQARDAAKVVLAKVALGEDPQGTKEKERASAARTLRTIVDDYLAMKAAELRLESYRITKGYLTGYHFRPLHSSAIAAIGRADIAPCLNKITLKSGRVTASRARSALATLFTWAMQEGHCDGNPVFATKDPGPAQARDRVLSDSEIGAIWNACGDDDYGKILKLLICTGCRREEIGGLRWSEIAPDRTSFTLPAERVKNNHAHTLPLLPLAQAIIAAVTERAGRDHLFGERSVSGFTGWGAAKNDLDERLDKIAEWTPHDIRRSVATWLAEHGNVEPHIIEAILNHYSGHRAGVAGTYNRAKYHRPMRQALSLWDDHLRSLLDGGERKVLPFHPQAAQETA
jgi:integrase